MAEPTREVPTEEFRSNQTDEVIVNETTGDVALQDTDNRVTTADEYRQFIAADNAEMEFNDRLNAKIAIRRDRRQVKLDRLEAAQAATRA